MERFLNLPPDRQAQAFQLASAETGWPAMAIEKDFWVTLILRELFALPGHSAHLTFKGGTSLSKAWGLIDRFSEDVDLTLDRELLGFAGDRSPEAAPSGKQRDRRLKELRAACTREVHGAVAEQLRIQLSSFLPDSPRWSLDVDADTPDEPNLTFAYPRAASPGTTAYLTPVVKLEFGARSDPWPAADATILPIAAPVLSRAFDIRPVVVRALRPERTFWEKVMLLHEEQLRPTGKAPRSRLARHYYDVWRLIESGIATQAIQDGNLFEQVAKHREIYFRQSWVDYSTLRRGRLRLIPEPEDQQEWRDDYAAMRSAMFVEDPPPFDVILATVRDFQDQFNGG